MKLLKKIILTFSSLGIIVSTTALTSCSTEHNSLSNLDKLQENLKNLKSTITGDNMDLVKNGQIMNESFINAYDSFSTQNASELNLITIEVDQLEKFDGQYQQQLKDIQSYSSNETFYLNPWGGRYFNNITGGLGEYVKSYYLRGDIFIDNLLQDYNVNVGLLDKLEVDIRAII